MARNEEADRLALVAELLFGAPGLALRERGRGHVDVAAAPRREEAELRARLLLGAERRPSDYVVEPVPQAGAVPLDGVEGATGDQVFEHLSVHDLAADAETELVQARERSAVLAGDDDGLDRLRADALDRAQSEPDRAAHDREVLAALVHVRRQHLDAVLAALGDVLERVVGVAGLEREQSCHELDAEVRLQIRGLVGDHRVRGRVALVEAVGRERLHLVEDRDRSLAVGGPMRLRALEEAVALRRHLLRLLLAHGAAEVVGVAERVAGERLRDLHHLLLIDDDAVGVGEDRLERGMQILDRLAAVLALDELRDHAAVEGTWSIERERGDHVREARRTAAARACGACRPTRPGRRRSCRRPAGSCRWARPRGATRRA
jgi:hypothetical protein